VNNLYIYKKLDLEINESGHVPLIIAERCSSISGAFINVYHKEGVTPNVTQEVNIMDIGNYDDLHLLNCANNTEFPFSLIEAISNNRKIIKFTKADYEKIRSNIFCISKTIESHYNITAANTVVSVSSLQELIEQKGIPIEMHDYISINIYIDESMDHTTFEIETNYSIHSIKINASNCSDFTVIQKSPNSFTYQTFESVVVDIRNTNDGHTYEIIMKKCNLTGETQNLLLQNFFYVSIDSETYEKFTSPLRPKRLAIFTEKISFDGHKIIPKFPISNDTEIIAKDVKIIGKIDETSDSFSDNLSIIIEPDNTINFTTNGFGQLKFTMNAKKSPIDVYFKAQLPVNFTDPKGLIEYRVHPHFFGSTLTLESLTTCTKNIHFYINDNEYIKLNESALWCGNEAGPNIRTNTNMENPLVNGVINMERITVDRSIYLNNDTYFHVNTFNNPDDDFLIYFNWTLDKVPLMRVKEFSTAAITIFKPSIQPYAYPSSDDEYIRNHSRIYNMGIPFLCIENSNYKGSVFHDGLVFRLNKPLTVSTIYGKIAQDANPGACLYFIPFFEPPNVEIHYGPVNKAPWIVIPVVSIIILALLAISLAISYIKPKKSEEKSEISMTLVDDI